MFEYLEAVLVPSLTDMSAAEGPVTAGSTQFLLGTARLRQQRIKKGKIQFQRKYIIVLGLAFTMGGIKYGKCSKSQTLLFQFSNKMWVIKAVIHKIRVRIANREDPDQTASTDSEAF